MSLVLTLWRHFSLMMKDSASYLMPCIMWIIHLRQGTSSDVLSPWKYPHFSKSFLRLNWADCERSSCSVPFPYACPNTCAIKTCRTKGQPCACTSYERVCMCIQACQAMCSVQSPQWHDVWSPYRHKCQASDKGLFWWAYVLDRKIKLDLSLTCWDLLSLLWWFFLFFCNIYACI